MEYFVGAGGGDRAPGAARELEAQGWTGLGVADHRATIESAHVWATLGALANSTERVVLTSLFANNLFRHPSEFAQAAITVNNLSGGRFEAGLGAGWLRPELEQMGVPLPSPRERVDRLREACIVVRALLAGEAFEHRGEHYTALYPTRGAPLATPPPPLSVALGGLRSCREIAPLVDRVEVMFGAAVAGGGLDAKEFGRLQVDDLSSRVEIVRDAAPDVAVGVGVFCGAGTSEELAGLTAEPGSLQARLLGEPTRVADTLRSLGELPIDRITVVPVTPGTPGRLAEVLFGSGSSS